MVSGKDRRGSYIINKYFYTFTLRSEPLDEILRIMARIQPMKYTFNEENELTISFADTKQKVK